MSPRGPALLLALAAGVLACDAGSSAGPAPGASERAASARGLSPDWALLSIPADGGAATLHPASDPGRRLWRGSASLPAVEGVVRVAPRLLALRGPRGETYRYDPAEDAVTRLGELAGDVRWYGGEDAGVWVRRGEDGATIWRVPGRDGGRRTVGREVRWAGPAAGGATVALLGSGPATLVRWPPGASEPDARLDVRAGPPAVVTAWGRIAVLAGSGEPGVLHVVSLEDMDVVRRIEVGGPITALAASASSHELYVAVDSPPRLVVVERISGEVRTRSRLPRPVRAIRTGAGGGPPIMWDGRAAHVVPWGGGEPVRLEGAEWRADLPLSLSDGSVLVVRDGAVARTLVDGGASLSAGSADRIWVPVRWRAEAGTAEPGDAAPGRDSVAGARGAPAGPDTAAQGAGADTVPADSAPAEVVRADSAGLDPGLAVTDPGFYVVVGWARTAGAVERRLAPLREEGFPVAVQRRRDDAGSTWYRALVGPYAERSRARGVARTLLRDHALEGRVEEVRPDLLSDEVLR